MNKSERLNDLMIYLNDKNIFNLKDLINKYQISKSTALRDIQSLEEIGMPIYSQAGRNGYYGILPNRLLSPIVFSIDEIYALYFAMLTLNDYQTTPFHLSTTSLKNKFEMCLSKDRVAQLRRMEAILSMSIIKHFNESPCLKDILTFAIENKVCEVTYKKGDRLRIFFVQFFSISSSFGQWYVTAYNFQSNQPLVLRCDRVVTVIETTLYSPKSQTEFDNANNEIYKKSDAIDFNVEITQRGIDMFHKENYPTMQLETKDNRYYIKGFYNQGEESFIANYFVSYAQQILSISPEALRASILESLNKLTTHYETMT